MSVTHHEPRTSCAHLQVLQARHRRGEAGQDEWGDLALFVHSRILCTMSGAPLVAVLGPYLPETVWIDRVVLHDFVQCQLDASSVHHARCLVSAQVSALPANCVFVRKGGHARLPFPHSPQTQFGHALGQSWYSQILEQLSDGGEMALNLDLALRLPFLIAHMV